MATWGSKDPDAVLDYLYTIALDAGDTVSGTPTLTRISGTVAIDSQSFDPAIVSTEDVPRGQNLTAWLSGGANGETSVFRVAWTTAAGRTNDDIITLAVLESDIVPLVLTDYAKPAPAHLQMRYPAFALVASSTIAYWLTDAERYVTNAWSEGDYAAGLMALAAHNMTLAGLGTDATATATIPAGVKSFRSGALSVDFTDQAANARAGGGYDSTRYGQEYKALLLRNRGGPLVAPTGVAPYGVLNTPDFMP